MKALFISIFLTIAIQSISQKVTYDNLIRTSWRRVDTSRYTSMVFNFVNSKHISQRSWAMRYQQYMETIIGYSLDTTSNPTLLTVEWKGEIMDCTTCYIRIVDSLLIIQNINNLNDNSEWNNSEAKKKALIFKKQSSVDHKLNNNFKK